MAGHYCHAKGCAASCPPRMLMCRAHWSMVPGDLQRSVYATVKERDPRSIDATWAPWWRASERAIAAVALAEGRFTREQHDAYVAHQDDIAREMEEDE